MDDDALGFSETKRALQYATLAGEWKMAHFPRRSAAALGGDEFVVLPECAIEKGEIAHVVREAAEKRHSFTKKAVFCAGRRGRCEGNKTIERKRVPTHRRVRAREDTEDAILFGEDAAHGEG